MKIKHKVELHLYLVMYSWQDKPHYMAHESAGLEKSCDENHTYEYVRPISFEVPGLPDPAEIDGAQFRIRGLRKAQQHLMAEYQKKLNELKAKEQSLLAIELEPSDDDLPF